MVVLLIIATFAVFVTVDLLKERRRAAALLLEGEALHNALEETEPQWVAGFKLPPSLAYHPGHLWVHWVTDDQAFVGLDDFARRLVGSQSVLTPASNGTHVTQGEVAVDVKHNGAEVQLLSPVSGEIVGVNPRLKSDPDLAYRDPYGRGWLYKVKSPRLFKELPNLLKGTLARRWMEDTNSHFMHRLMLARGSVIQDGGSLTEDLGSTLNTEEWHSMTAEFLAMRPAQVSEGR